ncbi:MAG: GNAT family N-acetyltransferase [Minwuiales bacterium]|nr:GNAT family N-acetyltransferase [Minwuiales bacterium]
MEYRIRRLAVADAAEFARFRMLMFQEMGEIADAAEAEDFRRRMIPHLETVIADGSFVGWLAESGGTVLGAGGANVFHRLPTPTDRAGKELYLLNMYTVPDYRGFGIAAAIVEAAKALAREQGANRIWLTATDAGRPVYAKAGFVPTQSEMQFTLGPH